MVGKRPHRLVIVFVVVVGFVFVLVTRLLLLLLESLYVAVGGRLDGEDFAAPPPPTLLRCFFPSVVVVVMPPEEEEEEEEEGSAMPSNSQVIYSHPGLQLWLLVLKDVLLHRVNVISITRERIYVFLLELAAALVWNRTSLILIILLPSSFLLVYPLG